MKEKDIMDKKEIIYQLANTLFELHDLTNWNFQFDNSVSRFGCCNWRTGIITLSSKLVELNNIYRSYQVLLHEIAHALTPYHYHDKVWQAKAKAIGDDGKRCYDNTNTILPIPKYIGTCACKGKQWKAYRKRRVLWFCRKCNEPIKYKIKKRI